MGYDKIHSSVEDACFADSNRQKSSIQIKKQEMFFGTTFLDAVKEVHTRSIVLVGPCICTPT